VIDGGQHRTAGSCGKATGRVRVGGQGCAASTLADYEGEDPGRYDQDEDFVRAVNGEFDRWVQFCTCTSAAEAYFLDIADRDRHGAPRVALSGINGTPNGPASPSGTGSTRRYHPCSSACEHG
jgi:hypothetical protein